MKTRSGVAYEKSEKAKKTNTRTKQSIPATERDESIASAVAKEPVQQEIDANVSLSPLQFSAKHKVLDDADFF